MAQLARDRGGINSSEYRTSNSAMSTSLISAHPLEHRYGRSFLVLIPAIYVALGLAPIQAGRLDAVRQLSSGITSMSGGFFVDMFQHRRAQVLSLSMAMIGIGYLLVAVALFGLFLFSVNSLTQAFALDVARGKGLEGTFIGLMWGSRAWPDGRYRT